MKECVLCSLAICALLLVANAQGEKEDPVGVGGSKEKNDIDTKVEVIQFPFDKHGEKTPLRVSPSNQREAPSHPSHFAFHLR